MSNFFKRLCPHPTGGIAQALLGLFAASLAAPVLATGLPSVAGALCDFGDPHFRANVARPLALPPKQWGSIFRWLQIGDSHTAGDYLTGELRQRLQARYGDAGIGWLTPGYVLNQRSESVKLSNESNWSVQRAARQKLDTAMMPFGGFLGSAAEGGGTMRISFKNPQALHLMRLSVLQPPSRSAALEVSNQAATDTLAALSANSETWQMNSLLLDVSGEQLWLKALPGEADGHATLGGVALERLAPGVVLDAVGINGAQIDEFLGWSESALGVELAARPPNLVVLAFGTNEAMVTDFDQAMYVEKVRAAVRRLRQTSTAAILLMSPPDIRLGRPAQRSRTVGCGQSPVSMALVNAALTRVARQEKTLLWDWGKWVRAKGGYCGTVSLAHREPPLAQPDFVHLTQDGYRATAADLLDDLLRLSGAPHIP
jgi:lysophospholipase L1-like esterase